MFKKITKLAVGSSAFLALASQAYASNVGTIQINRSGTAGVSSISNLISAGFNIAIILAIIFVFVMLIMGGYGWISAGGDKAKVEEARTRITNAIIGLALIASSYAIFSIIDRFFGLGMVTKQPTNYEKFCVPNPCPSGTTCRPLDTGYRCI